MKSYGVAVIGTGNVARGHVKAVLSNTKSKIVAFCTDLPDQAKELAAANGISPVIYTDLDKMLENPEIDIVLVCTPSNLHAHQAAKVALAGKNLLIEKPVALNLEELRLLEAAVRQSGVKTMVSFVQRWNPYMRLARKLIHDGTIGRLFMLETCYWHNTPRATPGHWMTTKAVAGSVFLMGGCHALDSARWLANSDIVEVSAFGVKGIGKDWYEYPHTVESLVKFASGAIGRVSASMGCVMPYSYNVLAFGDQGTLRDNRLWSNSFPGQTDYITIPTQMPDSGSVFDHPFNEGFNHFVNCIEEGRDSDINLASTMNVHEALLAIDRSVEEGKSLSLPLS
jgi:predicted dehydrogenase